MEKVTETTAAPPLFRRHVRRPRLTALLDASTAQAIVLTAPAGYGKTVLAQEWLTGRDKVAWYRASPASADVAAFSAGVAEAVAPIVPDAGDRLRQRLRVADTPEKLVRPLAELLAEDLSSWPDGAWLVVDDYHLVTDSSAVEEFVDWLLTLAPVRILVTTRRRPSWASARRVLYGEITEIGRDQLAMTNEEASRVLDGRSSDAIRALVAQAEGWPALIGLAALSASSELPRERVSDALFRYFAEEVFRREPPEVQHFMLVASIPGSLNLEMIRDVLGIADAEALLARLEADGLLHASDDGFRFHPLVRDFLRRKFEFDDRDFVARLRDGAIAAALRRKDWTQAFDLALEAGRRETAASIAGEAAPVLLASGQTETLEKWLAATGDAAFHDPSAVLANADLLLRRGRFSDALGLADDLARRLSTGSSHVSRAWYLAGQASHLASDAQAAFDRFVRARTLAETDDDLRNALWGAFVAGAELERDEAPAYFEEFRRVSCTSVDARLRSALGELNLASHRGTFHGMWSLFQPLVPTLRYSIDPMTQSNFLRCLAYMNVGRADYALARTFASRGRRFCEQLRLDFATGYCVVLAAAAETGLGRFASATRSLDYVRRIADDLDDRYLSLEYEIQCIRLELMKEGSLRTIADSERHSDTDLPSEPYGTYLGLLAIANALHGQLDRARAYADRARRMTATIEAKYYSAFADLIVQFRSSCDDHGSVPTLLASCAHDDFLDAVVLVSRASPDFAHWLMADARGKAVIASAAQRAHDHTLVETARGLERPATPAAPLTRRELEVLGLVADGLTNAQIARRLVISTSTAKVHVQHILKKLGVTSRLEAVLAAQDLLAD